MMIMMINMQCNEEIKNNNRTEQNIANIMQKIQQK